MDKNVFFNKAKNKELEEKIISIFINSYNKRRHQNDYKLRLKETNIINTNTNFKLAFCSPTLKMT